MKCKKCGWEMPNRSNQQNKSLWLFLTLLADALNSAGLEMRQVLKPTYHVPWTKDLCHDLLWIPIQKALYKTHSTRVLPKLEQIDKIHEIIMRELGEKHGLEYIPFPNNADFDGKKLVGKHVL